MKQFNEPTREGFELGFHLSRWADKAEQDRPGHTRCATCAFRCGTYASGSPTTTMDALKCVMEGVPFICHEDATRTCAGYALLRRGGGHLAMPWPFSDEVPKMKTAPPGKG